MAITGEFRAALVSEHRLDDLRRAAESELQAGTPREQVVAKLEALRTGLTDSDEDVVLEVLDFVTGWCSPYARLKRGSESHIADSRSTLKRITSRLLAQARAAHCVTGESNRQQGVGKSGCPVLATSTALRIFGRSPALLSPRVGIRGCRSAPEAAVRTTVPCRRRRRSVASGSEALVGSGVGRAGAGVRGGSGGVVNQAADQALDQMG